MLWMSELPPGGDRAQSGDAGEAAGSRRSTASRSPAGRDARSFPGARPGPDAHGRPAIGRGWALGPTGGRHLPAPRRRAVLAGTGLGRNSARRSRCPRRWSNRCRSAHARRRELPVEILVPFGVKINNRHWVTFHQERSGARAVSNRAQPPRTRVEDTVLDLCANGSTADRVSWITQAVQRRLTTAQALQTALGRRARISDRKGLTSLIADVASGVHSALEYRYLHEVERGHGLPPGKRQHVGPAATDSSTSPTSSAPSWWNSMGASATSARAGSATVAGTTATRAPGCAPCGSVGTRSRMSRVPWRSKWRKC